MKTPDLKPCPFCGGEGDFRYVCGEYFVMCNACHSASEAWTDKEKAAWSWNRRAGSRETVYSAYDDIIARTLRRKAKDENA